MTGVVTDLCCADYKYAWPYGLGRVDISMMPVLNLDDGQRIHVDQWHVKRAPNEARYWPSLGRNYPRVW